MADSTAVADSAATLPSSTDLERVQQFTREPFVLEGEDLATALAPDSARRVAFDAALAEVDEGAKHPSVHWRQTFSLLLGLERLLGEDEPTLVDGTVLSAHQVDALSGTLTALLAEAQPSEPAMEEGLRAAEMAHSADFSGESAAATASRISRARPSAMYSVSSAFSVPSKSASGCAQCARSSGSVDAPSSATRS